MFPLNDDVCVPYLRCSFLRSHVARVICSLNTVHRPLIQTSIQEPFSYELRYILRSDYAERSYSGYPGGHARNTINSIVSSLISNYNAHANLAIVSYYKINQS